MRLNRFLSASGFSSRRKGEEIISSGRVRVNGEVCVDPARNVEPGSDSVSVDGTRLTVREQKRWFVMNKPAGVIVSRGDTHGRATVYDLLGPETKGVFAVGRLDYDTSGVILFTDDGDAAHRLIHPSFEVEKVYRAEVAGQVTARDVEKVKHGMELDDGMTAPAEMRILESGTDGSIVEITLHEGRKRQARRMLDRIGHPVKTLERVSFGGITSRNVGSGHYRPLNNQEVQVLLHTTNKKPPEKHT